MVEKWNIGFQNQSAAGGLISDQYPILDEIAFRQTQHSSIPLFQYPIAFDYGGACFL